MGSECTSAILRHATTMNAFVVVTGDTVTNDIFGCNDLFYAIRAFEDRAYYAEVNPPLLEWWTEYYEWALPPPPLKRIERPPDHWPFEDHQPRAPPGEINNDN